MPGRLASITINHARALLDGIYGGARQQLIDAGHNPATILPHQEHIDGPAIVKLRAACAAALQNQRFRRTTRDR